MEMTSREVKSKLTDIINRYESNSKKTLMELQQLRNQLRESGATTAHPGLGPLNIIERYVSEGLIEVQKKRTGLM